MVGKDKGAEKQNQCKNSLSHALNIKGLSVNVKKGCGGAGDILVKKSCNLSFFVLIG